MSLPKASYTTTLLTETLSMNSAPFVGLGYTLSFSKTISEVDRLAQDSE